MDPESSDHSEVTSSVCAQVARELRKGVEYLGVDLKPGHALHQFILDSEWLAGLGPDLFEGLSRLPPSDHQRAEVAMLRMEQAGRLADALAVAPKIRNAHTKAKWLKGPIDRFRFDELNVPAALRRRPDDDEAQDHLLELEVAGRLARIDLDVTLVDPPDIIVDVGDGQRFAIACKRPKRLAGIHDAMRKGAKQIEKCGEVGAILVSADAYFIAPRRPDVRFSMFHARTRDEADAEGKKLISDVVATCAEEVERYLQKGAKVPIVICIGSFVYSLEGVGYANFLMAKCVTHRLFPRVDELSAALRLVMTQRF